VLTNIVNKVATTTDYATINTQMTTLINAMVSANSDVAFEAAASALYDQTYNPAYWTAASWASNVHSAIQPYATNLTQAQLQTLLEQLPQFTPGYPAAALQGQVTSILSYYTHNGSLPKIEWTQANVIVPMDSEPQDPTGVCQIINAALWFLGTIFTTLAVMCVLPEPAIVVICPAAAVIGLIVAVLAALSAIVCGF
jgi:hypothetical protein